MQCAAPRPRSGRIPPTWGCHLGLPAPRPRATQEPAKGPSSSQQGPGRWTGQQPEDGDSRAPSTARPLFLAAGARAGTRRGHRSARILAPKAPQFQSITGTTSTTTVRHRLSGRGLAGWLQRSPGRAHPKPVAAPGAPSTSASRCLVRQALVCSRPGGGRLPMRGRGTNDLAVERPPGQRNKNFIPKIRKTQKITRGLHLLRCLPFHLQSRHSLPHHHRQTTTITHTYLTYLTLTSLRLPFFPPSNPVFPQAHRHPIQVPHGLPAHRASPRVCRLQCSPVSCPCRPSPSGSPSSPPPFPSEDQCFHGPPPSPTLCRPPCFLVWPRPATQLSPSALQTCRLTVSKTSSVSFFCRAVALGRSTLDSKVFPPHRLRADACLRKSRVFLPPTCLLRRCDNNKASCQTPLHLRSITASSSFVIR